MKNPKGFTIFFAVLVSSLALAIGLAIYDLLIRELELSKTATESQYAIYAADTGAECALYWDSKAPPLNGFPSVFATSSGNGNASPPSSGVWCNDQDIAATAVVADTWPDTDLSDGSSAVSVFEVSLIAGDSTSPCAIVTVEKTAANPGDPSSTKITSRGRNTSCGAVTGGLQLERALEVNY